MKHTLDRALKEILGPLTGLRAVVLSVAPDGLIAWSWSRDERHEIALGFAALDRAATVCLEGLGASHEARSLLLTAKNAWVGAWPLYDTAAADECGGRERLVVTTVFAGGLQRGMVMLYGTRVRLHLRAALDAACGRACAALREDIVDLLLDADDPAATLRGLAEHADVDLRRLTQFDQLSAAQRRRLHDAVAPRVRLH